MIRSIVRWSAAHPKIVLGAAAVFVVGAAAFSSALKFDALPDITSNQVNVLTGAPGLTPEEVERRVARPIESVLGGLPGLTQHRSVSRYGICSVTAVFEDGVDPYRARQLVQERLNTLVGVLPDGVGAPELGPLSGGLGEIFHFTLSSGSRTPTELLEIAQYKVAPLLRSVPGVVEVNTWGGQRRTLDVVADPVRLAQRGLTLEALRDALTRATGSAAAGSLPAGPGTQALVRAVSFPRDASELGMAVVSAGTTRGHPIRVADLAAVRAGTMPRIGAATANGAGETVYLMAQMLRGANALDVMTRIHGRLPELRALLPGDVRLDVVYDRSTLVHSTLRTVGKNLLEGGLLVIGILLATLGSVRAGLLVALAIPLSMLGATVAMVLLGIPGNLMSLGAIDFGLVVDGSVVIVEHLFHSLRSPDHDTVPFRARVGQAAESVAQPMFFSVLVIVLVYVPILALTGVDGKMFRPMALTVVFALATSLVLSLVFVPAAAGALLRQRDIPARDPWLVRQIDNVYRPLLARAVSHPWIVAGGAVALLALGAAMFMKAGSEFVPQLDEGDLVIQTTRAPDVSLDAAVVAAGRLEADALAAAPEVSQVVSRVGSPAVATDIMGLEQADVFVHLRPLAEWRAAVDKDLLIAALERSIRARDAGVDLSFTQPIQMRFNELLGGAVTDVTAAVYGDDLGELRRIANEIVGAIRGERGAADVRVLATPDVSIVQVLPRALEAAQRGFTAREILDAVEAVKTGLDVGVTYDGLVRVPIRLLLATNLSAGRLGDLPLPTAAGGLVPLSHVADVSFGTTPILVSHQGGDRRLLVGFNVRGADLGIVVAQAQAAVTRAVKLPSGYRVVWGGQYENLQAASRRLTVVVPIVVVLILSVLFAAFRRLRPPLIIFLNVPFACVGGILALGARGMPLSISAAIGFIALSGIAVMNGVVLMARILRNQETGQPASMAAANAARDRARPVIMTALVAALGFIPMALAHGVGAEVQRPLATVVVGGLLTSTLLTLIILPVLYSRLSGPRGEPRS